MARNNLDAKTPAVSLLLPPEYLETATKMLASAKRRVTLVGLIMYRDPVTADFVEAIIAAARRGVEVRVAADFNTFIFGVERSQIVRSGVRSMRDGVALARELREAGVKFRWLGRNYGTAMTSRTHSKWLVIDDDVFIFGGVNTDDEAIVRYNDYMFFISDPELADIVAKEHRTIERADRTKRLTQNHRVKSREGEVLFDGGHPGRSVIYSDMAALARDAEQILLVSQYCPTGKLARILREKDDAKPGSVRLYFNPIENADTLANRVMLRLGRNFLREKNRYTKAQYLHAKFAIFTMADGEKVAISGSHNFVAASSHAGTREVALKTTDARIIALLEKFFAEHVA